MADSNNSLFFYSMLISFGVPLPMLLKLALAEDRLPPALPSLLPPAEVDVCLCGPCSEDAMARLENASSKFVVAARLLLLYCMLLLV